MATAPIDDDLGFARFARVPFVNPDGTLTREGRHATGTQFVARIGGQLRHDFQPVDEELTALAALVSAADRLPYFTGPGAAALATFTAFARTLLAGADAPAVRSALGLGSAALSAATDFQSADAELTALAGLVSAADRLPYFTGSGTASLATLTSFARTLIAGVDAAAMRGTLSLGTVATLASDADGTLAANSDLRVATQKAVKTYADQLIASQDAMVFKGVIDCSTNPNYPAADRGHTYRVSVGGKIGGASGVNVEAGDILLCLTDGTAAGTQAAVGANWSVIQANLDGAVIGPASATSGNVAIFSGTTGKLLADSGLQLSGTNTGDQFTSQAISTLLGRGSAAGAGAAQTITLGSGLTMTGTTLSVSVSGVGDPSYSPGSFTVVTETARIQPRRLKLTGTQRLTVQGTGALVMVG